MTSQRANILAHVSHFLFAGGVAFEIRTKQRSQNIATRTCMSSFQHLTDIDVSHVILEEYSSFEVNI
jgi:hypothetical protein